MIKTDFVVSGELQVNCYFVYDDVSKKAIIIDPGQSYDLVTRKIEDLDLKPELLINTHGHFDHILCDDKIREKYNIPLAVHKDDIEMLQNAELNASVMIGEPTVIKYPEIIFDKDKTKETSFCKYSVINTPGHSKGSVCILIGNTLFSGDTVFYGSVGRTDLFGGNHNEIISSVEKIKKLPLKTKIFPGHGPQTTLEREIKINPYF